MSSEAVANLFQNYANIEDPIDRTTILSLLYSVISSHLEIEPNIPEAVGIDDSSHMWTIANALLENISQKDQDKALEIGVTLTLLKPGKDEPMSRWMRTAGLSMLGLEELKQSSTQYFVSGERRQDLASALSNFMKEDISHLTEPSHLRDPEGFSAVQSVYIGLGMKHASSQLGQQMYSIAINRRYDSDIQTVYHILKEFEECQYLSDRFKNTD